MRKQPGMSDSPGTLYLAPDGVAWRLTGTRISLGDGQIVRYYAIHFLDGSSSVGGLLPEGCVVAWTPSGAA